MKEFGFQLHLTPTLTDYGGLLLYIWYKGILVIANIRDKEKLPTGLIQGRILSWKKLHVPLVLIISQLRLIEN